MQPKIKKHFSLFMVSKSIRKPSKKPNDRTSEIIIQDSNQAIILAECEVPRFLDPINCYHLYGDICFSKADYDNGDNEIGLLSNYNQFKKVATISLSSCYISLTLEKSNDQVHPWEFLFSRLDTLNNRDAHELVESMQEMKRSEPKIKVSDNHEQSPKPDYNVFCKELDDYCNENANNFYSLFRFQIDSVDRGLELIEIRHSKKTVEFFADDIETFAHLVLEQGVLNPWVIKEKNYLSYMKDSLTNLYLTSKPIGIYANTMEGHKVHINPFPFRRIFFNENKMEVVLVMTYEIEERQIMAIKIKREEAKKRIRKSFRDKQLEETLGMYYQNYKNENEEEKKKSFFKESLGNGYENNNVYLAEKKRCGIKLLDSTAINKDKCVYYKK